MKHPSIFGSAQLSDGIAKTLFYALVIAVLLSLSAVISNAQSKKAQSVRGVAPAIVLLAHSTTDCGEERQAVKVLEDKAAHNISYNIVDTTITKLTSIQPPKKITDTGRFRPVEVTMYRVPVKLVGYKLEADQDYHVVARDPANTKAHMIFEVPSPACASHLKNSEALRKWLDGLPHSSHKIGGLYLFTPQPVVKFIGVGFFDKCHGQTGRAKNCIELHPVLDKE
jgi:hypothetical protein